MLLILHQLQKLIEKQASGIYHVANPGTISFWEMLEFLRKHGVAEPAKEVKKLTHKEFANIITASGGATQTNPVLNTDKLRSQGIELPHIHKAVEDCVINLKKSK